MPDTIINDCSVGTSRQFTEVNALNSKLAYDLSAQTLLDNQEDSRAWSQLKFRIAQNAATTDHLVNTAGAVALSVATQTGDTSNQQTVDPVRTATGDAIVAPAGVSADAIAASLGNLATAMVPVIASAVATATSQTLAAVLPILIASLGNGAGTGTPDPKGTA